MRLAVVIVGACLSAVASALAVPVSVKTVTTEAEAGALQSFSLDAGLRWIDSSGAERTVPPADVVHISTAAQPSNNLQAQVTVYLTGGCALRGRVVSGTEQAVRIAPVGFGPIEIPLTEVTGLVTLVGQLLPLGRNEPEESMLPEMTGPDDVLLLGNGDRITGAVVRISDEGVTFDTDQGPSTIPFDRLLAAAMKPLSGERPEGLRARVFLADGSRIEARSLDWTARGVKVRFYGEIEHELSPEAVVRVEVVGGRWQWLSALEPVSYEHTPFLTIGWPWKRDRNVLGGPVRIGGTRFDRGIGVHSQSRLVYETGGAYDVFFSHFGLDDASGPLADVDIEVRVDGQTRFHKEHVRRRRADAREADQPIRIELDGAQRLELLVTFGRNGDVQDRFDWAGAALIR